jgi:uncharacterized membrane protein YgcG
MANILIGSSNVNRFYKHTDFPSMRQYKMVKCTQMSGFSAYMVNIGAECKSVLISVIENFIVDAVGADIIEPEAAIDKCIMDYLEVIQQSITKHPSVKFGIVMPLTRPAVSWYQERVNLITRFLEDGVKRMISDKRANNVVSIRCPPEESQQFDPDKIHLTKTSSKIFLDIILGSAENFFKSEFVDFEDLNESGEIFCEPNSQHLKDLEDRLKRLETTMRAQADKNIANDLMFARSREETDAGTNKIKEDRLVMNGLKSSTPLPDDSRLRIEALKKIAAEIFLILVPDFQGKIIYLSQGKNQGEPIPMVEVRLDKPEFAIAIRKAYAEKRKNKQLSRELESLFISNCVTLATRIRVDVMKAIARKVTKGDDLAYVAGFTSRPMMHIRKAGAPSPSMKPLMSFTYIDTISRFGHLVNVEELETAYGRAGRSFNGQLQQNFVVLNERDQLSLQSSAGISSSSTSARGSSARGGRARGGGGGGGGRSGYPAASDTSNTTGKKGTKRSGTPLESSNLKK